jgi:hypothetical protein
VATKSGLTNLIEVITKSGLTVSEIIKIFIKFQSTVKPDLVIISIKLVKPDLVTTSIKLVKPALVTTSIKLQSNLL